MSSLFRGIIAATFLLLAPSWGGPGVAVAQSQSATADRALIERARRDEFERRFKALEKATADFARVYKESKGQIWPYDKAEALRKAMEAFQKFDPAFRATKSDGERASR